MTNPRRTHCLWCGKPLSARQRQNQQTYCSYPCRASAESAANLACDLADMIAIWGSAWIYPHEWRARRLLERERCQEGRKRPLPSEVSLERAWDRLKARLRASDAPVAFAELDDPLTEEHHGARGGGHHAPVTAIRVTDRRMAERWINMHLAGRS